MIDYNVKKHILMWSCVICVYLCIVVSNT